MVKKMILPRGVHPTQVLGSMELVHEEVIPPKSPASSFEEEIEKNDIDVAGLTDLPTVLIDIPEEHINLPEQLPEIDTTTIVEPRPTTGGKDFKMWKKNHPVKKPHRWKPGTKALREIRKYQKTTDLLIPKAGFRRLCREVASEMGHSIFWNEQAFDALQESAEKEIVETFELSNLMAIGATRVTIDAKDMKAVGAIRREILSRKSH